MRNKLTLGLAVGLICIASKCGSGSNPVATPSHQVDPKPSAGRSTDAPTPIAPTSPATLVFETGTGNQTIESFEAPRNWDLKTIWNCPSGLETISVQIDDADGVPDLDQDLNSINQFDAAGTDIEHEQKSGTFSLSVMTDCMWTITAQASAASN